MPSGLSLVVVQVFTPPYGVQAVEYFGTDYVGTVEEAKTSGEILGPVAPLDAVQVPPTLNLEEVFKNAPKFTVSEHHHPHGGGPAFPYSALAPDGVIGGMAGTMYKDNEGITKLDYFAAAALTGLGWNDLHDRGVDGVARITYELADAMLRARAGTC